MAAAALHGIGKRAVLEDYTLDELLTVLDECAALQGTGRDTPDAMQVEIPEALDTWEE